MLPRVQGRPKGQQGGGAATNLNAREIDRFDRLAAAFVAEGVYFTTDLYVSRNNEMEWRALGIDRDGRLAQEDFKRLVLVHEPAFSNLCDFARNFLGHVNPYTDLAYNDDPAVMSWEINNECSLASSWFRDNLESKLTPHFRAELLRQFNEWLRTKYASTDELRTAWRVSAPLEPDAVPPAAWKDADAFARLPWYSENLGAAEGAREYVFDTEAGCVRIDAATDRKFALTGVSLSEGKPYAVSFRIRSAKPGAAVFTVGQHGRPYGNQGIRRVLKTGPEWQVVEARAAALQTDSADKTEEAT